MVVYDGPEAWESMRGVGGQRNGVQSGNRMVRTRSVFVLSMYLVLGPSDNDGTPRHKSFSCTAMNIAVRVSVIF